MENLALAWKVLPLLFIVENNNLLKKEFIGAMARRYAINAQMVTQEHIKWSLKIILDN